VELLLSTWPEIEAYLKEERGVIIPIGSMEQHGPTGFIGTDAICAEGVAKGVGEATGALVSATIGVGMSIHHTAFPGSLSLRPSTLVQVIMDHVFCLARYGFERFLLLNGHGGNVASVNAAFWEMYALLPQMGFSRPERIRFKLESWYDAKGIAELNNELFGGDTGGHATADEISMAMYLYPDRISQTRGAPRSSDPGHAASLPQLDSSRTTTYGPQDFRRSFPDGRIRSNPELATPEHGRRLYETAVKAMSVSYLQFIEDE